MGNTATRGKIEYDFTKGNLFSQIILFSIPIILTNVLQSLFNTVDIAVLGVLVGDSAVAAVGSTSSLVNLILSLFLGVSVGVNVLASKYLGAKNSEGVKKVVGLSVVLGITFGTAVLIIGYFGARFFLELMKSDPALIDLSTTYLKVYFLGSPLAILYNFLAAIMRAAGDSKRPLIYLMIGGVVNVILNIFFIVVLKMTVEGVAIATTVSQGLSSVLCLIALLRAKGIIKLDVKSIRFYKKELLEVLKIGIPAGVQSALLTFSNVLIQSSINTCGEKAVAGSSYAYQIEIYVYRIVHGVALAITTMVGQNNGAKNFERIKKSILYSIIIVAIGGIGSGIIGTLIIQPAIFMVSGDSEVVNYALIRMLMVGLPYFLCGIMEVLSNTLRALNKSLISAIISLLGSFGVITLWIKLVFDFYKNYTLIFVAYPLSWGITAVALLVVLVSVLKKIKVSIESSVKEKGFDYGA
ncbi:MAG: MATE family efflux transporter [Clostridiales bacterium]|nr:MATE family efflux transporter [Clostridiales bacterium]